MIKTVSMLLDELNDYQDPFGKINRLCKEKKLFQLTRGLYANDINISGYVFAPVIYGPSYLSFDYALAYYGIIPERVSTYTSATCLKGKKKEYHNCYGDYTYRDVPQAAFPLGIELRYESNYIYTIATAEKALCDKLYTKSPVGSMKEIEELLFENLRIDESAFFTLDFNSLNDMIPFYRCNNLRLLSKYINRTVRRKI